MGVNGQKMNSKVRKRKGSQSPLLTLESSTERKLYSYGEEKSVMKIDKENVSEFEFSFIHKETRICANQTVQNSKNDF